MSIRLQAKGVARMIEEAQSDSKSSAVAARWLAEKGWQDKQDYKGRPNKRKVLEEAARIDGASELGVVRKVTLPMIGSTIRLTVFLSVLGSLQQFAIVWILTRGGPNDHSQVIGTYLYKYIDRLDYGFGSSIAIVLFCMSLIFSLGYQWMIMRQDNLASGGQ